VHILTRYWCATVRYCAQMLCKVGSVARGFQLLITLDWSSERCTRLAAAGVVVVLLVVLCAAYVLLQRIQRENVLVYHGIQCGRCSEVMYCMITLSVCEYSSYSCVSCTAQAVAKPRQWLSRSAYMCTAYILGITSLQHMHKLVLLQQQHQTMYVSAGSVT
jgi:hypothetical protein